MKAAVWIIAICSFVRILQNGIQLAMLIGEKNMRKALHNEFIDSLRKDNREWVEDTLNEFLVRKREEFESKMDDDADDCNLCKYIGTDKCNDCLCGSSWARKTEPADCSWK